MGIHLAFQRLPMNRKILIVEDDEALLKVLHLLLENSYDITLAMNGKQGLEMANSKRPRPYSNGRYDARNGRFGGS